MFYFFSGVSLGDEVDILNAITGWDVTPAEAQRIGERIVCMQQVFNLNMGMVPEKENVMPERFTIPHKEGGAAGQVPPLGLGSLEAKKALCAVARDYKD